MMTTNPKQTAEEAAYKSYGGLITTFVIPKQDAPLQHLREVKDIIDAQDAGPHEIFEVDYRVVRKVFVDAFEQGRTQFAAEVREWAKGNKWMQNPVRLAALEEFLKGRE